MITLSGITKLFNAKTPNERIAVNDINLKINSGEFVTIVGNNGSGKSTLLNLIAGSLKNDSGKILLDEKDVSSLKEYERCRWIARIFQNPLSGTAPGLTVLENFRLASLRTCSKTLRTGTGTSFRNSVRNKISFLQMNLENEIDRPMGTLSGGQRQALTILMATLDETKILLLDEPASALDPRSAETVMSLADKIIGEQRLTAILVTHNLNDIVKYGGRIIQMKDGRIEKDFLKNADSPLNLNMIRQWFSGENS